MALLANPTNTALTETAAATCRLQARILGLQLHILHAGQRTPDFDTVFETLVQLRASALVIAINSFFTVRRVKLAALALRHGAAQCTIWDFAAAGGVMSYGGSLMEGYHLVGLYTGRVAGAEAADFPSSRSRRSSSSST